jgi:hypothetical protein
MNAPTKNKDKSETTQITTLDDGANVAQVVDAFTGEAVVGTSHDAALSGERVSLTIYEQEGDAGREAVFVGINGVGYQIPRGKPFNVPVEVVHVLENAVQTIYEPVEGGETRERTLKRFNFTVHGPAAKQ